MRILVVDDDYNVRKAVVKSLKRLGHEVIEAENGQQALVCLQAQVIEMMITDFQMSGMNGLELIAKVREKFPQLKVIITSGGGLDQADIPHNVIFLPKPVSPDDWEKHTKEAL